MPAPDLGKMAIGYPIGLRAAHVYLREQDVCVWNPSPSIWPHDLDRVNRLIAARYEQLPEDSGRLITTLHGQMRDILTLMLKTASVEHRSRWIYTPDREQAEAMPVALAFYVPHSELPDDVMVLVHRWAERLPPPGYGERALVWRDGGWQTRSIEQLGEDARELQAKMAAKLRELVAPSDWYQWTPELDACHDPVQYQRMRQDLHSQLLKKHGSEREQVRSQLMLLDTARNQALAIEALQDRREREGDKWYDGVQEVIVMARDLAALYWEAEQAAVRQVNTRTLPEIPNIFDIDGLAAIPSMMPVQTIVSGYSAAASDGWIPDDTGLPTYRQVTPEHDTTLQVRGDDSAGMLLDEAAIQALWAQVREYDDKDGDVFLAMLAQYMASADDTNGVWITGSQILDYRGVQPMMKRDENGHTRRAGHRQEDLMEVARKVAHQASQWVQINSMIADEVTAPRRGKKPQKKRFTHESKQTLILEVIRQHELAPTELDGKPAPALPIAWRYRMGTWLTPFLGEHNRTIAWLCRQALRYDPYHERQEKRLARYFVFHLRINAAGGAASITRHVGKLADELALPIDERNPQRTRDRFEQALDRLVADGVIDGWEYARENPTLPARHWLETWRGWKIAVRASAITSTRHARIAASAKTRRDRAATLHDLRAEREKRSGKSDTPAGGEGGQNG